MNKKCAPGIICFENMSFMMLVIICVLSAYALFIMMGSGPHRSNNSVHNKIVVRPGSNSGSEDHGYATGSWFGGVFTRPNYGYSNLPNDVLLNPYVPPLKDDRYLIPSNITYIPPGALPINVSTNVGAVDTSYRQVGILTPLNGPNKILSLMGRPLFTNRDKWQFFTMTENNIKLPIVRNGKSCTNEYGCDNIYNGDTVYVEGYGEPFKVTMYDNNTIKYLPFI